MMMTMIMIIILLIVLIINSNTYVDGDDDNNSYNKINSISPRSLETKLKGESIHKGNRSQSQ